MKKRVFIGLCVVLSLAVTLTACETYGQAGLLGAGLGSAAGAIIGNQSGHAGQGAIIGALAGGLVGLVAHDIKARKEKSQEETAKAYPTYQPQQGEMLTLERTEVMPASVKPGEMVTASMQYALLGSNAGVQVTEKRQIVSNGQVLAEVSTKNFTRTDGTWVSDQEIRIPTNLRPGTYTLSTYVNTAQSSISGMAAFTVVDPQR